MSGLASASAGPARRAGFFEALLTPGGFAAAWSVYILANAAIRYSLSQSLAIDDALESLLVAHFQLGYELRHPPLWEWLLWSIQQATGPGFLSHLFLCYGTLFLLGIGLFRACRAVSGSTAWAAAVALASPLVYQLGWPLFEWGTHSLLLAVVCLLSVEAAMLFVERPSIGRAAYLGLLVGLGFLAKYGYAIFLAGLLLAMLMQPASRRALTRPAILLVPVVAALVLSPYIYWIVVTGADLAGMTQSNLIGTDASHWARSLVGLSAFANSAIASVIPWPFLLAFALWQSRRRHPVPAGAASLGERIAGLSLLFSIALTVLGIVAFGITKMTVGYVIPILIMLLPWSACLLARLYGAPDGPRHLAMIAMATLVVVTLARLFYLSNSGFPEQSYRSEMRPYAGLAATLREQGLNRGTLVVAGVLEGGNMRAALPEARVVMFGSRGSGASSPANSQSCRLLWNDTAALWPGERWAREQSTPAAIERLLTAGAPQRHFDIPWGPTYLGTPRVGRWSMIDLDPADPLCR
jgi:4-amino-4-deoxy-L-arabinose transferase-like glycosyltransferase